MNNNFRRIITGAALGVSIYALTISGVYSTVALLLMLLIIGFHEIAMILKLQTTKMIVAAAVSFLPLALMLVVNTPELATVFTIISLLYSLFLVRDLYRSSFLPYSKNSLVFLCCYWAMPLSVWIYSLLHLETSNHVILAIFVLIWTTDSMAYFTGRSLGRTKLFPSISPKKTVEGFIGAGIFGMIAAYAISYVTGWALLQWIIIGVVTWVAGTYGDLVASKLKRAHKIKDSGTIFPGHGGILDRFDSFVFVLSIVYLIHTYL